MHYLTSSFAFNNHLTSTEAPTYTCIPVFAARSGTFIGPRHAAYHYSKLVKVCGMTAGLSVLRTPKVCILHKWIVAVSKSRWSLSGYSVIYSAIFHAAPNSATLPGTAMVPPLTKLRLIPAGHWKRGFYERSSEFCTRLSITVHFSHVGGVDGMMYASSDALHQLTHALRFEKMSGRNSDLKVYLSLKMKPQ